MSRTKIGPRPTNQASLTHSHSMVIAQWPAEPLHTHDDWNVYPDDSLERWEVYVDVDRQRTFVHQDTWDTIAWDPRAQQTFFSTYVDVEGETGMRFIVADVGPWVDAVRKEAVAAGTNVPEKKDRLQSLTERAQALILQAASLNQSATEGQAKTFSVRYSTLAGELAVLEQELARARGLVELAATAVVDAAT